MEQSAAVRWQRIFNLEDAGNIKLAEIAEKEVLKCYHGHVMRAQSNLHPLVERFHAPDCTADTLGNCWYAAFIYHCVLLSGCNLPVKAKTRRTVSGGCVAGKAGQNPMRLGCGKAQRQGRQSAISFCSMRFMMAIRRIILLS